MDDQQPLASSGRSGIFLPLSILIAGVLVAGALIYNAGLRNLNRRPVAAVDEALPGNLDAVRPVDSHDYRRGASNAPVTLITYEDTECPFCKRFHPTLQRLVKDHDGQVAWVYRYFPLEALHSKAKQEAGAVECAGQLGGQTAFWAYLDKIFAVTPSNDGLDDGQLPAIAEAVGLNRAAFSQCLTAGQWKQRVENDIKNATDSGGNGTPYTIVIGKNGKKYPISGALPYDQVELVVKQALAEQ